jgi:hypothetical protein
MSQDFKLSRLEHQLAASKDPYQRLRISREIEAHKGTKRNELPQLPSPPSSSPLQACIDREPAGPRQRDIAMLKLAIHDFAVPGQNPKLLVDYIKLLVQAEKSRCLENRAAGRTVERPQLLSAIEVFFNAYTSIVVANGESYFAMTHFCHRLDSMLPASDNIFHYVWRELVPEFYPAEIVEAHHEAVLAFKPRQGVPVESDYYIDAGSPDRADYERILSAETGRFRELISLSKLRLDRAQACRDVVYVAKFSKLVNELCKVQLSLDAGEVDLIGSQDTDEIGTMLLELFRQDFAPNSPNWRETLAARLDAAILREATGAPNQYFVGDADSWQDAEKRGRLVAQFARILHRGADDRWYDDALALVSQFGVIVRAIMDEQLDRDAVLERFIGSAERYPMPVCLA